MHSIERSAALLSFVAATLTLASPALGADPWTPDPRIATAVPEPSQIIDAYEGSLHPVNSLNGHIRNTTDDFDWWCLSVTSGVPLTVDIQAAGGTGVPNCGFVAGIANEGAAFQTLGQILAATNNAGNSSATLIYTPQFTGTATVWVSSAGSSFDLNYTVDMSGGQFNPDCGPTDIGMTKTVNVPNPNVGQTIAYTVTATNNGPATATDVAVTDQLPVGVTYISHTFTQGSYVPGTGVWSVGTIDHPGSATLTITCSVNSGTGGQTIINSASVTAADQTDPSPGNNTATASITVQSANLGMTKTVNNPTPNVGQSITYTVTVANTGPNNATNVEVTDQLNGCLTYVSNTTTQGTYVPGTGVWTVGTVNNGANAILTITATVNGCAGQTVPNTASVTHADQADPSPGNNTATASITVQSANLGMTKTVNNPTPNVGQSITYTVTVANTGPNNATNVEVTDPLNGCLTYVSNTTTQGTYVPGTGAWTVGTVNNGANAILTITATVNGCAGQTVPNTASVTHADQADPVAGNNSATVNITVQSANLGMTKTVNNPTPNVGQSITYTVTVANTGPNNATNVEVTDQLNGCLTYVSNTTTQGTYVPGTGVWTVGTVNNGANAILTITATVNGCTGQVVPNTASVTHADQADPVAGNNSATVNITVQSANLGMTKTVNNPTPNVGQNITYTVTVANTGPNNATNVEVTDPLNGCLTYVSNTTTQGTYVPGTGAWTVGTVNNGANAILTITATVNGCAGQTVPNTASVTHADQADPVAGNNSASVNIQVGCPDVDISGTVTYYSNGNDILPGTPPGSNAPVTVYDCNSPGNSDPANAATYSLSFGDGPFAQICICASRPKANCNLAEGGVISGADLIILQDFVAQIGTPPTPRQVVAGDLNRDGQLFVNDELALKQWIAKYIVCSQDLCLGQPNDNCAGTWRFIYPWGAGPSDFDVDNRCLTDVCVDETVDIEGVLLGDVDGSWPNIFPLVTAGEDQSKPEAVGVSFDVVRAAGDVVRLVLKANLESGESLHHVIYSLDYDAGAFEYLGARLGSRARDWGLFDNPDQPGTAHGIAHRLARVKPITASGEIVVFEFRARTPDASLEFSFGRLKLNDVDANIEEGRPTVSPLPVRYALSSSPNPFNPSTRVRFAIPESAGTVPVTLEIYDITGRLLRTLLQERRGPGVHEVLWNGTDEDAKGVGTGIYFIRIRAGEWSQSHKVALIK